MASYTIGDAAERSGFPASTLRYYEELGLVAPAARTAAGYRVYDDQSLALLSFVARAKQLGCSLEEIRDLLTVWDDERCGPVQRRFHELVTAKLVETRSQIAELAAFTTQLEVAADHLAGVALEGPCDDDCACNTAALKASSPSRVPVGASTERDCEAARPSSCSLAPEELEGRLDGWRSLLSHARSRSDTAEGAVRFELDHVELPELAQFVAAEQECCPFLSFTISADQHGIALEIQSDQRVHDRLTALFEA
jgi:DNA-binding transcriptional MerR regulator